MITFDTVRWALLTCLALGAIFLVLGSLSVKNREKKHEKIVPPPTKEEIVEKAKLRRVALEAKSNHKPLLALVIGGSGTEEKPGAVVYLGTADSNFIISSATDDREKLVPINSLTSVDISGPGTQTTNAGIVGGGFGLAGAVQGMLAATLINAATTRKKTDTFLRIATSEMETHFHLSNIEPSELRLVLSPLFVAMESKKAAPNPAALANEIQQLKALHDSGALNDAEFSLAKKKILGFDTSN